jgi:hypothetical protein
MNYAGSLKGGGSLQSKSLKWVALFAAAMAYVEAAAVVYLRRILGVTDLIRDMAPFDPQIARVEVGRELATLIMITALGWALGRSWQARWAFACYAFGLWDIFYYVWLRVLLRWPGSFLDPDVLFLIPLPWWGPVLSPVLIALLAVIGGAMAARIDDRGGVIRPGPARWAAFLAGTFTVLYAFMADALAALPASAEDLGRLKPTAFLWPVYLIGLGLMSWSVFSALRAAQVKLIPLAPPAARPAP